MNHDYACNDSGTEAETEYINTPKKRRFHDVAEDERSWMMRAIQISRRSVYHKQKTYHPRDGRIRFEPEGHIYYIDGNKQAIVSVTELIGVFYHPFPTGLFIWRIQNSEKYKTDRYYKYYKKTAAQIKGIWEESRNQGTYNHKQLKDWYNGDSQRLRFWDNRKICKNTSLEDMFWRFNLRHSEKYEPFRMEIPIFADCGIAGAPDIIYRNKMTGELLIGDFKFTRCLKDLGRKARAPFQYLKDNNRTRFSLQLSFYRYILETWYGYKFEGQFVLLLHQERKNYREVDLPYRKKDVQEMIQLYKIMLCILYILQTLT